MQKLRAILAPLALTLALTATSSAAADPAAICGDVNTTGSVSASDALSVLRKSVGQPVQLTCLDYINQYGHPRDTNLNSNFEDDYLLGFQIDVAYAAKVTHFGLITREAGPHVQLALYTDNAGSPGNLVVSTASTAVVLGSQEIAIAPTDVAAGKYWLVGVFDTDLVVAADENNVNGNIIKYRDLVFGSPLPATFGPTSQYDSTIINYWIRVQQ